MNEFVDYSKIYTQIFLIQDCSYRCTNQAAVKSEFSQIYIFFVYDAEAGARARVLFGSRSPPLPPLQHSLHWRNRAWPSQAQWTERERKRMGQHTAFYHTPQSPENSETVRVFLLLLLLLSLSLSLSLLVITANPKTSHYFIIFHRLSPFVVMDQSCQDIPMRLDIKHQPLNFDIYLEQEIDIPKTSIDEKPYDFQLELDALNRVDQIIGRTLNTGTKCAVITSDRQNDPLTQAAIVPSPSCPMEVPLTPMKYSIGPITTNCNSNQESNSNRSTVNQINPHEFEEIHYNPFDHLELQTIDELKELDLVFQASYANRASKQ
jgi:hypothetical protein